MASLRTRKAKLAVAAIFKNEAPYVLEWVAFHRAVGADRFFIADNASDDGTTELLAGLAAIGVVTHIPFPHVPDSAPQMPAYEEILRRHAFDAQWIAFIDADEFLTPEHPDGSVIAALDALGIDVAVAAVNWALYGSSGHRHAEAEPVTGRFVRRALKDAGPNHHYKAIVRTALVSGIGKNPHSFAVRVPFRSVHIGGAPLIEKSDRLKGVTARVDWSAVRINHYVVKSFEEFVFKKRARGRATSVTKQRSRAFFESHDRNEEFDPMDAALVERTRLGIADLKRRLIEAGVDRRIVDIDRSVLELRTLDMPELDEAEPATDGRPKMHVHRMGRIGRANLTRDGLDLRGWAVSRDKLPEKLRFRVGSVEVEPMTVELKARPDVQKRFAGAPLKCGFRMVVDLAALGDDALLEETATVTAFDPPVELKFSAGHTWREILDAALAEAGLDDLAADAPDVRRARIAAFLSQTAA